MTLLRLLGQGGKRRLDKEVVLPIEGMSDEWILKTFFALKKEGMRRGLLSRYGYRRSQRIRSVVGQAQSDIRTIHEGRKKDRKTILR